MAIIGIIINVVFFYFGYKDDFKRDKIDFIFNCIFIAVFVGTLKLILFLGVLSIWSYLIGAAILFTCSAWIKYEESKTRENINQKKISQNN